MRIAVIHDWYPDIFQEFTWKDGLCAAIRHLGISHEISFYTLGKSFFTLPHEYFPIHVKESIPELVASVKDFSPNVILHWADFTRPCAQPLSHLGIPMALCFAGGDVNRETSQYFNLVFVESDVYLERMKAKGIEAMTAFGTNTDLFKPLKLKKYFDATFPATYCEWKRHELFSSACEGLNTICAGYMYEHQEQYCYTVPQDRGVFTLPHVSAEALRSIYAASKTCVVTSRADGGSQRTVLEAMAMNVPVIAMSDSDKTSEYIHKATQDGFDVGEVVNPDPASIRAAVEKWSNKESNAREYVLRDWSHIVYAENIERGLKTLL